MDKLPTTLKINTNQSLFGEEVINTKYIVQLKRWWSMSCSSRRGNVWSELSLEMKSSAEIWNQVPDWVTIFVVFVDSPHPPLFLLHLWQLYCTMNRTFTWIPSTLQVQSSSSFWPPKRMVPCHQGCHCITIFQTLQRNYMPLTSLARRSYSSISLSFSWLTFSTLQMRLAAVSACWAPEKAW